MHHLCQKIYLFLNIGFSMIAGGLLVTAGRLFLEPFTYEWLQLILAPTAVEVVKWYISAAGLYLTALVGLGVTAVYPRSIVRLNVYLGGSVLFVLSEAAFISWLVMFYFSDKDNSSVVKASSLIHQMELFPDLFWAQTYVVIGLISVSFILQVVAMVLCCILQRSPFARRHDGEDLSSKSGWKSSNEYSYHANGQGTSFPRTSRMWNDAPTNTTLRSLARTNNDF